MFGLRGRAGSAGGARRRCSGDRSRRTRGIRSSGALWRSVYCEFERRAECRSRLRGPGGGGLRRAAAGRGWLFGVSLLALRCAFLGDVPRAKVLHDTAVPYADRNALSVPTSAPAPCRGHSASSPRLWKRWDEAAAHFEAALAMNARTGARPWLAQTQREYGRMLLARGASGDRKKAGGASRSRARPGGDEGEHAGGPAASTLEGRRTDDQRSRRPAAAVQVGEVLLDPEPAARRPASHCATAGRRSRTSPASLASRSRGEPSHGRL